MSSMSNSEFPPVRKAVIPVAGLGTRFLPATKATPKEMLPVVDKPAIQYVVEEAVAAGLTDVLMVTGRNKRPLEDHFDRVDGLEAALQAKGDQRKLELIRESSELADIHFVRQGDPLGLGHAVLKGEHHVGEEPFAVLLGDDLIDERSPILPDMIAGYDRTGGSVIALMEVPHVRLRRGPGDGRRRSGPRHGSGGEAGSGGRAVEPGGHRPLRPVAGDLPPAAPHGTGAGR